MERKEDTPETKRRDTSLELTTPFYYQMAKLPQGCREQGPDFSRAFLCFFISCLRMIVIARIYISSILLY